MIESLLDVFYNAVLFFLTRLPSSPFSFDEYVSKLQGILPQLNYFIPFYLFSNIITLYGVFLFGSISVYVIVKLVMKRFTS